ncbi:hypothetical protein Ancab_033411 [Ancistrocladus abbreviatus]
MPFLALEIKGHTSVVIHDVPISKPLPCAQELGRLLSFVDRIKQLGDVISVLISKHGELHLKVSNNLVTLGVKFKRLKVVGERAKKESELVVVVLGMMMVVVVDRVCLQFHLAKPDCAFYGVRAHIGSKTGRSRGKGGEGEGWVGGRREWWG